MIADSRVGAVRNREDFVAYVEALARDIERGACDWENTDLPSFLNAVGAWVKDMDGYYKNVGEPVPDSPTWKTLAQILSAALVYE